MKIYWEQNKLLQDKIYTVLVDFGYLSSMDEFYRINGVKDNLDEHEVELKKPSKIQRKPSFGISSAQSIDWKLKKLKNSQTKGEYNIKKKIKKSFDSCIPNLNAIIS